MATETLCWWSSSPRRESRHTTWHGINVLRLHFDIFRSKLSIESINSSARHWSPHISIAQHKTCYISILQYIRLMIYMISIPSLFMFGVLRNKLFPKEVYHLSFSSNWNFFIRLLVAVVAAADAIDRVTGNSANMNALLCNLWYVLALMLFQFLCFLVWYFYFGKTLALVYGIMTSLLSFHSCQWSHEFGQVRILQYFIPYWLQDEIK